MGTTPAAHAAGVDPVIEHPNYQMEPPNPLVLD